MELLRRRGELDGVRLLSAETVDLMTPTICRAAPTCAPSAARPHDEPGNVGVGFGLGVSVVIDPVRTDSPVRPGHVRLERGGDDDVLGRPAAAI